MGQLQKQLLTFVNFIKLEKVRKIKFLLLVFFFLLLPTQSYYSQLKIASGDPVIRSVEVELPKIDLYPVNVREKPAPLLSAFSVLVIDVSSKTIILAKNPDYQLPPASTTKIMTGLVTLDQWPLDKVLEIKTVYRVGQTMDLEEEEKITVRNLLYGLLVQSGNDAAYALAENYPGGVSAFVKAMNNKGKELNLWQTNFRNPMGIDAYGHLTTVHDLAVLAAEAMNNKTFAQIVATSSIIVNDESGEIEHQLENINQLVGKVAGVKGVKTGWTENAGECLVAYTKRNKGEIITVVLGSEDRFQETQDLIEWVFGNFSWQPTNSIPQ